MAKMRKISMLSMILVMALFSISSCAPTVSEQEYERVNNELSNIQSQLASLQGKLAEAETMQARYQKLNTEIEELSKQYNILKSEYETMQAKHQKLSTDYEELNKQYNTVKNEFETMKIKYEELSEQSQVVIEEITEINAEDVEQAVFKLVNWERENNGLDEQLWGANIYKWARANSVNMAKNKQIEYSEWPSWQEVYWATGYSTADEIAEAALMIWQNSKGYEQKVLNSVATYGAVAVHKLGDIFYITYIASNFR